MKQAKHSPVDTTTIRRLLETGEYYEQARSWYDELYHRPLGERSFFVVITLFSAVTIFLSLVVYSSMFPLNPAVPYIIASEVVGDDVPFIAPLREKPAEDLNLAVARFLIKNYVITREKYKYDVIDLERRFNRIRATTHIDEFARYQSEVNPENPSSPYNKYGRDREREVVIQRVRVNQEVTPMQAKVYFVTTLARGQERQVNQWLATISFRFPSLTVDQETNKVLQWDDKAKTYAPMQYVAFEVVGYTVQEIGGVVQQ